MNRTTTPKVYGARGDLKHTLKTGELVYIDSFGGLIPAKITNIDNEATIAPLSVRIEVQVTAVRPGYKRGEKISCRSDVVVARRAVFRRDGQFRIIQLDYKYEATHP